MAASITVHLQIFKHLQLFSFSTDLNETGIKIHGLIRSFIKNVVIVRVAVPFKSKFEDPGIISLQPYVMILNAKSHLRQYQILR